MKGIKLSQLILLKRVGWLLGTLLIVAATGWKIGYDKISPLFSSGLTIFPNALGFLFLSYLFQAQATRSLIKDRPPSLFSLWRLKIVSDAYNKISFLTPFRGDTLFRKVLEKKRGVIEATEILILDRAIAGIVARRLPFLISEPEKGRYEEADRSLRRLLESNRSLFWLSLSFQILSFIPLVLMVYWLGRSLSGTFTLLPAFLLMAVLPLFGRLFRFLPSSLGLFEIASALLMTLFYGSDGIVIGFLVAVLFRLVQLASIVVGLVIGGNPTKVLFR